MTGIQEPRRSGAGARPAPFRCWLVHSELRDADGHAERRQREAGVPAEPLARPTAPASEPMKAPRLMPM